MEVLQAEQNRRIPYGNGKVEFRMVGQTHFHIGGKSTFVKSMVESVISDGSDVCSLNDADKMRMKMGLTGSHAVRRYGDCKESVMQTDASGRNHSSSYCKR